MPQGEVVRSWIRCRSQCARNLCFAFAGLPLPLEGDLDEGVAHHPFISFLPLPRMKRLVS